MTSEWVVSAILVPGEWIVRQEGNRYAIYWAVFDAEVEYRGSADTPDLAQWWARRFHDDMVERLALTKKDEPKRERKSGEEEIWCPGQLTIFDSLTQTSPNSSPSSD